MTEERDFEVIDRRRVGRTDPEAPPTPPPAGEEATAPSGAAVAGEQSEAEPTGEEAELDEQFVPGPTDAVEMVKVCLGMLGEVAWVKIGLVPDPGTGEIQPDLAQARLAIDCAGDLIHRLDPYVDGATRRDLGVMLQNLKLNFVKKSS